MKRSVLILVLVLLTSVVGNSQFRTKVKYGSNPIAGRYFTHDGVKLYYEVYGRGEPLLVIHGNGGSILDMSKQIEHFRKRYRVIAMDSRDHGRSADSSEKLTYEKMTDDLAALLDHLKAGSAYVIGWSDGGIEALMLGMRHPRKVKKIAAMAANLNPTDKALRPEALELIRTMLKDMPQERRASAEGKRELKVTGMMLSEPNVDLNDLKRIVVPTLIMAGDHDMIDDHHTVDIVRHTPNAQLAIFPGATHAIPYDDPVRFNSVVDRFLSTPFRKIDRVNDAMTSIMKLRGM